MQHKDDQSLWTQSKLYLSEVKLQIETLLGEEQLYLLMKTQRRQTEEELRSENINIV